MGMKQSGAQGNQAVGLAVPTQKEAAQCSCSMTNPGNVISSWEGNGQQQWGDPAEPRLRGLGIGPENTGL